MLRRATLSAATKTTTTTKCPKLPSPFSRLVAGIEDLWTSPPSSSSSATLLSHNRSFSTEGRRGKSSILSGGIGGSRVSSSSLGRRRFASVATSPAVQASEEFQAAAAAAGFDAFESMLTTGGDDRSLILDGVGTNKYHIKPQPIDAGDIFRGSCTGNPPTERGYNAAKRLFQNQLSSSNNDDLLPQSELDLTLREIYSNQRTRLSHLLHLPPGAEIILVPSGSDAEYLPIAIAKAIQSKKSTKIVNGITQLREIGAGSAPASVGEWFSTHAPLLGVVGGSGKDGVDTHLEGFDGIDGKTIPAREIDGSTIDASLAMDEFLFNAQRNDAYPILHGVFGGKTGLRDDTMPPSLDAGDTSLGVVDACQARFTTEELHGWLAQDSIVLFTGSKFYQAPPFCGAVILPPAIVEKLRSRSYGVAPEEGEEGGMFGGRGLGAFLTDKELPSCLNGWKGSLRREDTNNVGLALRWEAGLAGMEALVDVPEEQRTDAVREWANAVSTMVNDTDTVLDAWCVERSIISIRVANVATGGWRSMSELRDLYRWMSMDVSDIVPDATKEEKVALAQTAYIGQPVDVAETHAIVRIALGVESMLGFVEDRERTLREDQLTVRKLAAIGKHFESLKKSGL